MAALQQILPLLHAGLERMQDQIKPDGFIDLGARSRASALHDFVFAEARRVEETLEGIEILNSKGLSFFRINKDVNVRLHKGEPGTYRTMVNQTRQTRDWNVKHLGGPVQFGFVPDPDVNFKLVYVVDEFWSRYQEMVVGLYFWEDPQRLIELDLDDWYEQLPVAPDPIAPQSDRPRLRIKPDAQTRIEEFNDDAGAGN